MASAIVINLDSAADADASVHIMLTVVYLGVDVPNGYLKSEQSVALKGVSLSGIQSAIAAQIRSIAVAQGFTVGANQVFLPNYVAQ